MKRLIIFFLILKVNLFSQNDDQNNLKPDPNKRKQISYEGRVAPFTYICKLSMIRSVRILGCQSGPFIGTGSFISPNCIITANHNTKTKFLSYVKYLHITICQIDKNDTNGLGSKTFSVKNLRIIELEGVNVDISLIFLPDSSLYNNIKNKDIKNKFEMGNIDSIDINNLHIAGYPNDVIDSVSKSISNSTLYYESLNDSKLWDMNENKNNSLKYNFYTRRGMSGAPVWTEIDGKYILIGVHRTGIKKNDKVNSELNSNIATPINNKIYKQIIKYLKLYSIDKKEL